MQDLVAKEKKIELALAKVMLSEIYQHPQMDFESVLASLKFKKVSEDEILGKVPFLEKIADESGIVADEGARVRWIMGQIHKTALGNIAMNRLAKFVEKNARHKTPTKRAEQ